MTTTCFQILLGVGWEYSPEYCYMLINKFCIVMDIMIIFLNLVFCFKLTQLKYIYIYIFSSYHRLYRSLPLGHSKLQFSVVALFFSFVCWILLLLNLIQWCLKKYLFNRTVPWTVEIDNYLCLIPAGDLRQHVFFYSMFYVISLSLKLCFSYPLSHVMLVCDKIQTQRHTKTKWKHMPAQKNHKQISGPNTVE